jgi:flagellar assembly protein FliH
LQGDWRKKARSLLEARVEKKSLSNKLFDTVQPYEPVKFEDSLLNKKPLNKGTKEEDIQARIRASESEGYKKGYEEGYERGLVNGEKEIAAVTKRLEGIIRELEDYEKKKANELLSQIIDLSLEIAKKVIHKEVELDKNIVMYVAQDAIKKLEENEENIIIKVNPLDYEVMIANINLLKEQSGVKNIAIEPLSAISPGSCYIETKTGEIDARIEEQIKEVKDVISTATDREV